MFQRHKVVIALLITALSTGVVLLIVSSLHLQTPCEFQELRVGVVVGNNGVVLPPSSEIKVGRGQTLEISAVVVTAPQQCGGAYAFDWRQLLGANPSEVESRSLSSTEGMLRFVAGNRVGENVITLTVRDRDGVVQGRRSLLVRVEGD